MATNILTFQGLHERLLEQTHPNSPTGAQTTAAKLLVNDGYLRFLSDYDWSFVTKIPTVTLWPTTTTAAVTVSGADDTELAVAVDTFYESMEGRSIVADTSGTSYTVVTYTDAKNLIVDADASADTGDTFTIAADGLYGLPSDFGQRIDDPVLATVLGRPRLDERPPEWVRTEIEATGNMTGPPVYYAIVPRDFSTLIGQRWDMLVCPIPSSLYPAVFRHRFDADVMTEDAEFPLGGGLHGLTILQAGLMIHEQRGGDTDGVQAGLYYKQYLPTSIQRDQQGRAAVLGSRPIQASPQRVETLGTYER